MICVVSDSTAPTPLRSAVTAAGLTTEQFADQVGVDARTVRRWFEGRIPYPRYRLAISQVLDLPQDELWPELPSSATQHQTPAERAPEAQAADIVAGYPHAGHPDLPTVLDLFAGAHEQIDITDRTLPRPAPPTHPETGRPVRLAIDPTALDLLHAKHREGVTVRVFLAGAPSDATLTGEPTFEIRFGRPAHAIYRADDQILLAINGIDPATGPRPVLHVQRRVTDGIFDRLAASFQAAWDAAGDPATAGRDDAGTTPGPRPTPPRPDDTATSQPGQIEPAAAPARRWPRRPDHDRGIT